MKINLKFAKPPLAFEHYPIS